jgi:MFS transporter, PAT family, beta-lactamase induction signal transducer AmpG
MLLCVLTGFSSGLPLFVLLTLIPAWLRKEGIDLGTISLLSLFQAPYTLKFSWAWLLDRFAPFGLGRRRGWALASQLALLVCLAAFGAVDPHQSLPALALLGVLVAVFSATQDVALDAYRRELLDDAELGLGNSLFINAYRVASLVPASLALILADSGWSWPAVHACVAAFMGVGIVTSLAMPEPVSDARPRTVFETIVEPLVEFFARHGVRHAFEMLLFMVLYKLGDSMATALSTPFYIDLGFSLTEIGATVKVVSLWASVTGAFIGGALMLKIGINRALWLFGVLQLVAILGFAVLSEVGPELWVLFVVVSVEYLGVGMGTAAFVAFIARSTSKRFTAFQFALLTALTALPRMLAGAGVGDLIEAVGYTAFFVICAGIALPGLLLLPRLAPWNEPPSAPEPGRA